MNHPTDKNGADIASLEQRVSSTVMGRIAERRLARARVSASSYGALLLAAAIGLVPAMRYAWAVAQGSGFLGYVSLISTDGLNLYGSWKPLLLSLAESAPAAGGILVVLALFVLAYSARKTAVNLSRMRRLYPSYSLA